MRLEARDLCELLRSRGLHVVTAADKAVLDAMAAIGDAVIEANADSLGVFNPVIRAELARREGSK